MNHILPSEFDITKVGYGVVKTLDNGAKHIRLTYKRGQLSVQTPEMVAPFGLNKWENPGAAPKYSIQLSFKDIEDRPELQEFKAMLGALDKKLVDDIFSGALPTHNKKFTSRDVVEVLYQPLVKSKDEKFAPNFKINLPANEKDEFLFPTYKFIPNSGPQKVDLKTLHTKGAMFAVIMTCVGVWQAGGANCGVTFKATQVLVIPAASNEEFAFKNVGRYHEEEDLTDVMQTEDEAKARVVDEEEKKRIREDDDDEGDDDEEDEEDVLETPVAPKGRSAAAHRSKAANKA